MHHARRMALIFKPDKRLSLWEQKEQWRESIESRGGIIPMEELLSFGDMVLKIYRPHLPKGPGRSGDP